MCLAQGPQRSDAGEARTRGPSVSSQALYHWATALPTSTNKDQTNDFRLMTKTHCVLRCTSFNSLPTNTVFWCLMQTVLTHKTWGLIWIQTVWHSDGIPERIFGKKLNLKKKKKSADDKKNMKN